MENRQTEHGANRKEEELDTTAAIQTLQRDLLHLKHTLSPILALARSKKKEGTLSGGILA